MAIIAKDVAEAIRKQSRVFQAIIDVGAALDDIGSLDGATSEAQQRLAQAKAEEAAVASAVDGLKNDIKALTSKKADHLVRIEAMLADADEQCKAALAKANVQSKAVLAKADTQAALIIADAESVAATICVKTADMQAQLDGILAAVEAATKERTALQRAIDAIKNKFS